MGLFDIKNTQIRYCVCEYLEYRWDSENKHLLTIVDKMDNRREGNLYLS